MSAPKYHPDTAPLLMAARMLISEPGAWAQGNFARAKDGHPVSATDEDAECWCAAGAVLACRPEAAPRLGAWDALETAAQMGPTQFNDRHSHAEVLAMFDRAIALADA